MIRLPLKVIKEENNEAGKGYNIYLIDADGTSLWAFEDEETMRFIAKACNNYSSMLSVLQAIKESTEIKLNLLEVTIQKASMEAVQYET